MRKREALVLHGEVVPEIQWDEGMTVMVGQRLASAELVDEGDD